MLRSYAAAGYKQLEVNAHMVSIDAFELAGFIQTISAVHGILARMPAIKQALL